MKTDPLIILGTGMAGYGVARMLRMRDKERPLLLLSRDGGEAYAKPMLSKALSEGKTAEDLVHATAEQQAAMLEAEIRTHTKVTALRPDQHEVELENGESLRYSQLVLANGARPIRIPVEGSGAGHIQQINWLDDYRQWRIQLQSARRILIIGPGLIGMEFASDLLKSGYQPMVAGPDHTPLGRLVPEPVGRFLQQRFTEQGIELHLQTTVQRLDRNTGGFEATLSNGENLQADAVLMAVGLQPDTHLAQQAGLTVDRGVRVNEMLQTSNADIFALGDVAQYPQGWMPYVAPITAGARALAATLCGQPTAMHLGLMPIQVKTGIFPLWLLPPPANTQGQWELHGDSRRLEARFVVGGKLLGWVLGGDAVNQRMQWLKLAEQARNP